MTARAGGRVALGIAIPSHRPRAVIVVAAVAALVSVAIAMVGLSLAVFTAQTEGVALFGSKALFPGERVTPAFAVGDS